MAFLLSIYFQHIANLCLVSGSLFNAALYKPAYMSSEYPDYPYPAFLATDGSDESSLYTDHCVHTDTDNPGWWMVDLRGFYTVEQITILNRGDDYISSVRTRNFTFDVFKTDPRQSPNFPMASGDVCYTRTEPLGIGEMFTQNCTTPIMGRFVRFIRYNLDKTNICEVKVMASDSSYRENHFSLVKNAQLQVNPIYTTYTDNSLACMLLCLGRRDSDTCTAVNWVRTTKQCQLVTVNPHSPPVLTPDLNTDFYVEA